MRSSDEKNRHSGNTGEARLMLSALNKVQHFGSFQQPIRGIKDDHLPAPDSISFYESQFDDAEERKSTRRRKWLRAYGIAVAIITALFILFTLWLDNHIK